jgi:hypothetical protein
MRDKMVADLELCNYSKGTCESDVRIAKKFVGHFMKPADELGAREVRTDLLTRLDLPRPSELHPLHTAVEVLEDNLGRLRLPSLQSARLPNLQSARLRPWRRLRPRLWRAPYQARAGPSGPEDLAPGLAPRGTTTTSGSVTPIGTSGPPGSCRYQARPPP